jgi:uncharacterized membrane protein (UPF0127 family)
MLFFGFLATCLGAGLWMRFKYLDSEGKAQVGALIAAFTYWFVHSSVDWFWQLPAVTLPAIIYLAMLVGPWQRIEAAPLRWPLRAVGAGAAVLAIVAVAPLYRSDLFLLQSERAITSSREGLALVERAQRFNPLNPALYQREAALAMLSANWNRVENAYGNAIRLDPDHHVPYMWRAYYYDEVRGDPAAALSDYQEAQARNPLDRNINQQIIELIGQVPVRSASIHFITDNGTELGSLNLTVANDAPSPESPLQGSATLSPDAGMLFAASADTTDPLYIEGTDPPSHIAFIDARGRVTELIRSTSRSGEERVDPQQPYRLAIAAPHNFLEGNEIWPGTQALIVVSP